MKKHVQRGVVEVVEIKNEEEIAGEREETEEKKITCEKENY